MKLWIFVPLASVVLLAGSAIASPKTFTFECRSYEKNAQNDTFTFKLAGRLAEMTRDGSTFEGKMDADYTPRENQNFYRYEGWDGLDLEADAWVLVEKCLLKGGHDLKGGAHGGRIKIQARGETFDGATYGCVRQ